MLLVCLRKPEWNWHTDLRRANLAVLDNTSVVPINNSYGNALGPEALFSMEWINHTSGGGGGMMPMFGGGHHGGNRGFGGGGGKGGGQAFGNGNNRPVTNMGRVDFTNMGQGPRPAMMGKGGGDPGFGPPPSHGAMPPRGPGMQYGRPPPQQQQQFHRQQPPPHHQQNQNQQQFHNPSHQQQQQQFHHNQMGGPPRHFQQGQGKGGGPPRPPGQFGGGGKGNFPPAYPPHR
jgi:hypothetical protein